MAKKIGLLAVNIDHSTSLYSMVSTLDPNTNLVDGIALFATVADKMLGQLRVMIDIYPIMISHVFGTFEDKVESSIIEEVIFIVVIFVGVLMYSTFLYVKPMRDFEIVDIGRRKVLKIIPVGIVQENKALKFYLIQDFSNEIEDIKNTL